MLTAQFKYGPSRFIVIDSSVSRFGPIAMHLELLYLTRIRYANTIPEMAYDGGRR